MSDYLVFSMEGGRVSKNPTHCTFRKTQTVVGSLQLPTQASLPALSERRVLTVHSRVFMVIVKI